MKISVYATPQGTLGFRCRLADGSRRFASTTHPAIDEATRKILAAKAVLMTRDLEAGLFLETIFRRHTGDCPAHLRDESPSKLPTIREYFDCWIERQRPPRVAWSTQADRRWTFERLILPRFGETRLGALTPTQLADFQAELLRSGKKGSRKPQSVRQIIDSAFRALWTEARTVDHLITDDPFAHLSWPQADTEPPDPFTEEERDRILAAIRNRWRVYYPWAFFQFWVGTRPSESVALRHQDVDLEHASALIRRSSVKGVIGFPKTRRSRRTVTLLPQVVEALTDMPRSIAPGPQEPFFVVDGAPIRQDRFAGSEWPRILTAAQVRPRKFYATRHTFISVALLHSENPLEIAEHCGTSLKKIQENYARWIGKRGFQNLAQIPASRPIPAKAKDRSHGT